MKFSREDGLIVLLLCAATASLFARTVRFDYIYCDDPEYTFEDDYVPRGLTIDGARHALRTFNLANWHPLTWLSYMLDVQLFGLSPRAFHRTNVVLHTGNAILLFLLLRAMTGSRWRSALAAALFAVHPLRVESVAWIAERKDVLSTFFGLLAMLAYVGYARRNSASLYCATILLFALCLMSKPMLVTLPAAMLLIDYWPLDRFSTARVRRLIVEKGPLLLMSALSCMMTARAAARNGAIYSFGDVSLEARLANATASYARYLYDMFWPAKLVILYPFSANVPMSELLIAIALLTSITAVSIRWIRRWPHLFVGWFWYLGLLVPVIGLVAIGEQSRADRYTYFAMIGVLIMLVWSIPQPRARSAQYAISAASAILLMFLWMLTWRQLAYWRDSGTLFDRTLAVSGSHASVHLGYGTWLADKGDWRGAADHFRAALALKPNSAPILMSLGCALDNQGRPDLALPYFRESLRLDSHQPLTFVNAGGALMHLKQYPQAEIVLREALRLRPGFAPAREQLDNVLRQQGKPPE